MNLILINNKINKNLLKYKKQMIYKNKIFHKKNKTIKNKQKMSSKNNTAVFKKVYKYNFKMA